MGDWELSWVPVSKGRMTLWHRPKLGSLAFLPQAGCTDVLTLLTAQEGAEPIGEAARAAGLHWHWLPLQGARPPVGAEQARVVAGLEPVLARLEAGASVLVHCSAGIHRTGMIANGLLRMLGHPADAAHALLGRMRAHTGAGVRPEHLAWGESVARPPPGR